MKEKLPLYIGIIGLIIFICIMSMMYSSVKFTIYWVIVPMILLVLANVLFRYLNDMLASIIMALAIVIAFHFMFHTWLFTSLLFVYLSCLMVTQYVIKNKKRSNLIMHTISTIYIMVSFFIVFKENLNL